MTSIDFIEELSITYPELMEKSDVDNFSINEGWQSIIKDMFAVICWEYESACNSLRAAIKYPRDDNGKFLTESTERVAKEKELLPCINQIKEKFGHLRVYIDNPNSNEVFSTAIRFAELTSKHTCQVCGATGTTQGVGWISTLCENHGGNF